MRAFVVALGVSSLLFGGVAHAGVRHPLIHATRFSQERLPEGWKAWDWRYARKANVHVRDGKLILRCDRYGPNDWRGAAVILTAPQQTYGRFVVRLRVERAAYTRALALLWPADNDYPPEVDFFEVGQYAHNRQKNSMSVHWREDGKTNIIHRSYVADMTRWHTLSAAVRPQRITFRLDGHVMPNYWGDLTTRFPNPGIREPLKLHLKIVPSNGPNGREYPWPNHPSRLFIDYVKVFD